MNSRSSVTLSLLSAALTCGAAAQAQTAGPPPAQAAAAEPVGVGDIVVTAQRREESLQKVPIAVTALTAAQLSAGGITSSQDIAMATPGLTMTNNRNTVTPYLRGVGTQSGAPGSEGSVSTYVDGVYYSSAAGSIFALNNVERVEVLKGPQGTLFGRNATGGLIQVITRDPSQRPELDASAGYGNYNTFTGTAYVTGGITPNVAADLAVYGSRQGDGWGRNYFLGNDVNLRNEWAVRGKLKFEPGSRTKILLSGDYAWWQSDIGLTRQALPGGVAQGGVRPVGTIYDSNSDVPFANLNSNQWGVSARITQDITDDITLTSTTAFRKYHIRSPLESDGTPAVLSDAFTGEHTKTVQQELLLNGKSGRLDWTGGFFFFYSDSGVAPRIIYTTAPSPSNNRLYDSIYTYSYAGFAQANYAIADSTKLTAGLRYTTEKRNISGYVVADPGNTVPDGTITQTTATEPDSITHNSDGKLTWRFALDHQFGSNVLGYASYSRGFKAGGFNSSSLTTPAVKPETLDAYEVGLKSDLFNKMLRFNASAFYYDYKNIQLQVIQSFVSVVTNAAKGTIKGADADITFVPPLASGRLEMHGGMSYLHARYDNFPNAQFYVPRDPAVAPFFGGNISKVGDASGHQMVRSPSLTLTASASYSIPLNDRMKVGADLDFSHTGKYYWDPDNRLFQAPVNLLNGQLWIGRRNDAWRVRLWAKNILAEKYFLTVTATTFDDGAVAAPPRTFGAAVDFKLL